MEGFLAPITKVMIKIPKKETKPIASSMGKERISIAKIAEIVNNKYPFIFKFDFDFAAIKILHPLRKIYNKSFNGFFLHASNMFTNPINFESTYA